MDMIGRIRHLHARKNKSEREIARMTGLSRNTVAKWLHGEVDGPPKYRAQRTAQQAHGVRQRMLCHPVRALPVRSGFLQRGQRLVWRQVKLSDTAQPSMKASTSPTLRKIFSSDTP